MSRRIRFALVAVVLLTLVAGFVLVVRRTNRYEFKFIRAGSFVGVDRQREHGVGWITNNYIWEGDSKAVIAIAKPELKRLGFEAEITEDLKASWTKGNLMVMIAPRDPVKANRGTGRPEVYVIVQETVVILTWIRMFDVPDQGGP